MSDDTQDNNPHLPSLLTEAGLSVKTPDSLEATSNLATAKSVDVGIANDMIALGYAGLNSARSVSAVVKLGQFILQATRERRHLMNLQYGSNSEGSKTKVYDPLD